MRKKQAIEVTIMLSPNLIEAPKDSMAQHPLDINEGDLQHLVPPGFGPMRQVRLLLKGQKMG